MSSRLSTKERGFIKDKIRGETGVQAALNNYDTEDYDTAASIASENLRKPKIVNALEKALPDDLLAKVHVEGLHASKEVWKNNESGEVEKVSKEPDYAVRHKYLDSAYKLKGSYAPEKSVNVSIEVSTEKQKVATEAITRFLNGNI